LLRVAAAIISVLPLAPAQCLVQPLSTPGNPAPLPGLLTCLCETNPGSYLAGYRNPAATAASLVSGWFSPTSTSGAWSVVSTLTPNQRGSFASAIVSLPTGQVVVAGAFTAIGGVAAGNIAISVSGGWAPLAAGTGLDSPWATVVALAVAPNGDLIAGGEFVLAGSTPSYYVARWNGTTWQPLGAGLDPFHPCRTLLVEPDGNVLAGSGAGVQRWDGTTWSPVGTGLWMGPVPFSGNGVSKLVLTPAGMLVAQGVFYVGGSPNWTVLARLVGTTWQAFPALPSHIAASTATVMPNGDLVVGFDTSLQRWDGATWTTLASSVGLPLLNWLAKEGYLVTARTPSVAAGTTTFHSYESTCAALASPSGSPCNSLLLEPDNLPWLGTTYQATAQGLGPNGIALVLVGLQALGIPLSQVHPAGSAQCLLRSSAELSYLGLAPHGQLQVRLTIPDTATLIGASFHEQVLQLHPGSQFDLAWITSSNLVTFRPGVF
jgi:hypothetical protein